MSRRPWSPEEIRKLTELYPHATCAVVADYLGRSERSVYSKSRELELDKTPEFYATHGQRFDGMRGGSTRFQKGHATWNKDMKGLDIGGKATRFGKGHMPHNWRPIGHTRVSPDGYLERKIADTRCTRRDFVAVHRLVWRWHDRDIPPGYVVVFRDGNPLNVDINNLDCISRIELMRRNTVHNLPKEIAELVQLRGALNRKINNRTKRHEQDHQ